jgi:DNA modification methylase
LTVRILNGDCRNMLATLPDESVHCVVTSPPYWGLRDYGVVGQLGMEATYQEHIAVMVDVFREVRRVLRGDGTLWLNYGDTYASTVNGRSAADVKALTDDDRTFRDKPFSTVQGTLKPKDLCGIPWRVAFALQDDGWWLRQDIIWSKPNPMPESIRDRCTKAHEYIFMMSKSARYFYDQEAIKEPMSMSSVERLTQPTIDSQRGSDRVPGETNGNMKAVGKIDKQRGHGRRHAGFNERWKASQEFKPSGAYGHGAGRNDGDNHPSGGFIAPGGLRNKRSVWTVATQPFTDAHFATFPPDLIEPCIKAGCPAGGTVLDPFGGAGTTGLVADRLGRNAILIELNPAYAAMAERRITNDAPLFAEVGT